MPYALDPEIGAPLAALVERQPPAPARGDWRALRTITNEFMAAIAGGAPTYDDVETRAFTARAADGAPIELRWYAKGGAAPGPAVVYAHGGGMILGTLDLYDPVVKAYVAATGTPFLSVDYRLAPEAHGEMLVRDTFAGLAWLIEHAAEHGVDPARIALMGDSAGGGIAAGTAILARDQGVALARQILIYPMLDDRTQTPDAALAPFAVWTWDNNFTGWSALLGDAFGTDGVSPLCAPARLKDVSGLAPAYIEVGELDIFRNEDVDYARRLMAAGIPVELHVHPGAPHAFERFAPDSAIARRAMADRIRAIKSL